MSSQRGTALLSILWILLIISVISLTLAAAVRGEVGAASDSFDSERAFFMAKGAAESLFLLFARDSEIPKQGPFTRNDAGEYLFSLETGDVRIHFESPAGLIDLNAASDKLLAGMFDSVGVSQEERNHLVDSILDWRDSDDIPHLYGAEINDYKQIAGQRLPRNGPFSSVDELLLVKNMTPEVFNGSLNFDTATGQYRRIPGVRELVTVDSNLDKVDANEASTDVLQAIPQLTSDLADRILTARKLKLFGSIDDLVERVPAIRGSATVEYLTAGNAAPSALVSTAMIRGSGVSRTVRLVFKRDQRFQVLQVQPLLYRIATEIKFSHWQF